MVSSQKITKLFAKDQEKIRLVPHDILNPLH